MTGPRDPFAGAVFANDFAAGRGRAREFLKHLSPEPAGPANPAAPLAPAGAAEVAEFNAACGNASGARAARELSVPGTLAVVTGQQPTLLASPLYVILKALAAVAAAGRASKALGRTVVPVFWVASDDHDFDELRQGWLRGPAGGPEDLGRVVSRGEGVAPGSPAFLWSLDASAARLGAALERTGSRRPFSAGASALLASALEPGVGFEGAFCRILAGFLGGLGIVFVAPRMAFLRTRQVPVLRAAFANHRALVTGIASRGGELAAAGYEPALMRPPDTLNAFWISGGIRCRLVRRDGRVVAENPVTRRAVRTFSPAELDDELSARPHSFSPNVVTRPVLQDLALPVLAYVGGPGELAYLSQLAPAYEVCGTRQSAALPRWSATVLDGETLATMLELGLKPGDALNEPATEAAAVRADALAGPVMAGIARIEAAVADSLREMAARTEAPLPHLAPAFTKTARTTAHALRRLRMRVLRQAGGDGDGLLARYTRLLAMVQPNGLPQDRVLSPLEFCRGEMEPSAFAAILLRNLENSEPFHQDIILG